MVRASRRYYSFIVIKIHRSTKILIIIKLIYLFSHELWRKWIKLDLHWMWSVLFPINPYLHLYPLNGGRDSSKWDNSEYLKSIIFPSLKLAKRCCIIPRWTHGQVVRQWATHVRNTVKHLLFAWPYFREVVTDDLFTKLYFRDSPCLLLLSSHK